MVFSPLLPFPYPNATVTNITPVTYRDAATFLEQLETIKKWLNDYVIDGVNDSHAALIETVAEGIANAEATVLAAKDEWLEEFDAYMVDVNASLMALNDAAMAGLIGTDVSETWQALAERLAQRKTPGTFWIDPVTGLDTNTGTEALPLATIGEAFDRIEPFAQDAETDWVINLSAGVYDERVRPSTFTPFALHVTIAGPAIGHPTTPLTIFTEGTGAVAVGMFFSNPNAVITVKDIKFVGYNGSTSSCGISSTDGQLFTVNVHADNCYFGTSGANGHLNMKGGIIENCGTLSAGGGNGAGTRSQFKNFHYIGLQGAGNLNSGPIYRNNVNGVFAQEFSTGHVEYCTFEDNVNGIALNVNSRANAEGSSFKRNNNGINARGNSHANIPASVVFGTGADANGQNAIIGGGSQAPSAKAIDTDMSYSRTLQAINGLYTAQVVTGTTASVAVYTRNLLAPWWNDTVQVSGTAPKRLKIRAVGAITGVAGTKLVSAKMGNLATSVSFAANEAGAFSFDAEIIFVSPTRQIINGVASRHFGDTQRMGVGVGSEDMTTDKALTLNVGLGDAADTVTFEFIELYFG